MPTEVALAAFWESRKTFEALPGEEKLEEHAWLIDVGPMSSDPAARFDGLPKHCRTKPVECFQSVHGDLPTPVEKRAEIAGASKH